jgi:hypothetical protein
MLAHSPVALACYCVPNICENRMLAGAFRPPRQSIRSPGNRSAKILQGRRSACRERARCGIRNSPCIPCLCSAPNGGHAYSAESSERLTIIAAAAFAYELHLIDLGASSSYSEGHGMRDFNSLKFNHDLPKSGVRRWFQLACVRELFSIDRMNRPAICPSLDRRPVFANALLKAKKLKAAIVVAKLDRLSRDVACHADG